MASSQENDEELVAPRAFCRRLTKEEHEAVVSAETEKQLDLLLNHLQENPTAFVAFLKKRKLREMEKAGFFSNLKVKVLSALYGDEFVNIDPETCEHKWKEFEATTVKAYNSSQESKGKHNKFTRRYSARLAEKQKLKEQSNVKVRIPAPPPPPPVLPPTKESVQKQADESRDQSKIVHNNGERSQSSDSSSDNGRVQISACTMGERYQDIRSLSSKIVKRRALREVSNSPVRKAKTKRSEESTSFDSELLHAKENLRPVGKLRREVENNEQDENRFPLFNQELIRKFQNARSPDSPRHSDCDSTAGYYEPSP